MVSKLLANEGDELGGMIMIGSNNNLLLITRVIVKMAWSVHITY